VSKYFQGYYCKDEKSVEGIKTENLRTVLQTISHSYPWGITPEEIHRQTGIPGDTVYGSLRTLTTFGFIKKDKYKRHRGKSKTLADPYSESTAFKFHVENRNFVLNKNGIYQLAPGCTQYNPDFLNAWSKLVEKHQEDEIYLSLMKLLNRVITKMSSLPHDRILRDMSPRAESYLNGERTSMHCQYCDINHEARDFIRAMLLHLIDRFEMTDYYVDFLKEQQYISDEGAHNYDQLIREQKSPTELDTINQYSSLEVNTKEQELESIIVRFVSIKRDKDDTDFLFLAIDKEGTFYNGKIDSTLVSAEVTSNKVIECLTDDVIESDYGNYIELHKELGHNVKIVNADESIPTLSAITSTKIGHIINSKCREFILEACILDKPIKTELTRAHDRVPATKVLVGDDSSNIYNHILLEKIYDDTLYKLNIGDRIRILGALKDYDDAGDICLRVDVYGSIEKIEGGPAESINKIIIVGQTKTIDRIIVTLHKIEFADRYTAVIMAIENMNNDGSEISFYSSDFRAFQGKRQVGTTRNGPSYREMRTTIPSEIEEYGVIKFESLDHNQHKARFQFRLSKSNSPGKYDFLFDVDLSR